MQTQNIKTLPFLDAVNLRFGEKVFPKKESRNDTN